MMDEHPILEPDNMKTHHMFIAKADIVGKI